MQNLIIKYKLEIERYSSIISDENSTNEEKKDAAYFKKEVSRLLRQVKGELKLI